MRICTNCGRILDDDEDICRVCNSDLILDTGDPEEDSPAQDEVSKIDNDESASEISDMESPDVEDFSFAEIPSEQNQAESGLSDDSEVNNEENSGDDSEEIPDEVVSVLPDNPLSQAVNEEIPSEEIPSEESNDISESGSENSDGNTANSLPDNTENTDKGTRPDKIKIISVKVPNDERLPHVNRSRVILVISALLALSAVIFAVFMVVIPLVDARKQDEAARISAYMQYLEGQWLSETFIYSGQEFPSCEILTLNKNNTFTAEIWTSPNDRETYDPETWTVTARQTGQFRLELDSSSLRVSYVDDEGNTMVYRRYILKLDTASLVLREYYNEKMTEYFDVVLSRYSPGE